MKRRNRGIEEGTVTKKCRGRNVDRQCNGTYRSLQLIRLVGSNEKEERVKTSFNLWVV